MTSAGPFVVTSTVLYLVDEDGVRRRRQRGETVMVDAEDVARLKRAGAIADIGSVPAGAAESDVAKLNYDIAGTTGVQLDGDITETVIPLDDDGDDEPRPEPPPALERPKKAASVAVWRDYIVAATSITAAEADGMTKDQLQAVKVG